MFFSFYVGGLSAAFPSELHGIPARVGSRAQEHSGGLDGGGGRRVPNHAPDSTHGRLLRRSVRTFFQLIKIDKLCDSVFF